MSSISIHAGVQSQDREQKKFCGNKTSRLQVVKHVEIWQFFFAKVVQVGGGQ